MGSEDNVRRFPELNINVTSDYLINFADAEVESVLKSQIGQTTSLGVTQTEAQNCTNILENWFKSNPNIRTFDELNEFGPVVLDTRAFNGASNLRSINLSTVTRISNAVFQNCTNLNIKVNVPNATSIGAGAFNNTGISEIENLGEVESLDAWYNSGFCSNCGNLRKVVLPSTCTKLGSSAFNYCTNLTEIGPLNYLTTLKEGSLATAGTFGILYFPNVTEFSNAFSMAGTHITRVRQLYLPKNLGQSETSGGYHQNYQYHSGAFGSLNAELIYLRDITRINGCAFSYCTCNTLVINNTTPPVIYNHSNMTDSELQTYLASHSGAKASKNDLFYNSTISNIYVPDSAVNTYKTAAVWSNKASIIKPISELTKVATEADLQDGQIALIEAYM